MKDFHEFREGMFDIKIPAPKNSGAKKTASQNAKVGKVARAARAKLTPAQQKRISDKIQKHMAKDIARSKGAEAKGQKTRTNDFLRRKYKAGTFNRDKAHYVGYSESKESVDEAYYRGQRKATPKKQEPPKMGSKSGSGYDLYHKSYSGALQHAYAWAKKKGYTVDPDDIDSKVASGPKKPSEGRTNSFTLKLKDNPRKMLAVQVYGMGGGKYELNTYIT